MHSKFFQRRWLTLVAAAFIAIVTSSLSVMAGKPAPPPPPPPVPKMRIQFFDVPNPSGDKFAIGMNNQGQVVGVYSTSTGEEHAFLYDPEVNPTMAVDLNDLVDAPEGWVIAKAYDINELGVVVGRLNSISDSTIARGFVCDLWATPPTVQLLPDTAWSYAYAYRINEHGDVLGRFKTTAGIGQYVYHMGPAGEADAAVTILSTNERLAGAINNPVGSRDTQVLGQDLATGVPYRWTRGKGFEYLTQLGTCGVYDMNDSGTICGWSKITTTTGSGKFAQTNVYNLPMRYTTSLQTLSGGLDGDYASCINSSGDVVTSWDRLYSDLWGFRTLNNLIDPADPNAAAWNSKSNLFCTGLNDRDETKCGQVMGSIWWADGTEKFFLLTPTSP